MRETEYTLRFFLTKQIVKFVSQKAETEHTIRFLFFILTETNCGSRLLDG